MVAIIIVFPLLTFFKIPLNRIFFLYILFLLEILVSGLINNTGLVQPFIFSRFLIISFATYLVAYNYFRESYREDIFKICLILGLIQFPVVLLQRLFSDFIINYSKVDISYWDVTFGTFFIKDDPAMTIFLIGLILILLFDKSKVVKHKAIIIIILISTIFLSGSKILQLATIMILGVYILLEFSLKKVIYISFAAIIILFALSNTRIFQERKEELTKAIVQATFQDSGDLEAFKSGDYNRTAAVLYYINQPVKWFGDGPGKYFDVKTRERELGNTGHVFTIYSEAGLIGLLLSYLILYQMTRICANKLIANLYFVTILILSFTSNVLGDAGIVLGFNIFLFILSKPVDATANSDTA
jgi:hypothetical protein